MTLKISPRSGSKISIVMSVRATEQERVKINEEKQVLSKLGKWEPDTEGKQKEREGWLKRN